MLNVVKKYVSSELVQEMVDKAVAKARNVVGAIGVSEAPTVQNDIDSARAALAEIL